MTSTDIQWSADRSIWRILDANLNRASEGLRVLEDWARFGLDDSQGAAAGKTIRHALNSATQLLDHRLLLAARSVATDVGCAIQTPQEYQRRSPSDLLQANFKRVQQALRSLEETGKLVSVEFAAQVERLRYQSYELERRFHDLLERTTYRLRIDQDLCVLIDAGPSWEEYRRRVTALVEAQTPLIQLRLKGASDGIVLRYARELGQLTTGSDTRFLINDRPDLAALAGAHGTHVGQDDLSLAEARVLLPVAAWVGQSTHDIEQVRAAVREGADYLGVGPTFPSQTKSFERFPGLEFVSQVAHEVTHPWFAIGGIDLENAPQVLAAGARRLAIGNAIWRAADPAQAVHAFRTQLATARE